MIVLRKQSTVDGELKMSTAEQRDHHSPESYLDTEELSPEKNEFVNGYLRAMSGATVRHNQVAGNSHGLLWSNLNRSKCKAFTSDMKIRIRRGSMTWFYYPDASVVCESNRPSEVYQDKPVLVIEILSRSTRSVDLDEKLSNYLGIDTLQMYLILEQDRADAVAYRRTNAISPGDLFVRECYQGLAAKIELPFLGFEICLSDIYSGVEFPAAPVRELEPDYRVDLVSEP